jgi:hypothetical protein
MTTEGLKTERPRQERSDVDVRGVFIGALGVIATVLLVALAARFLTSASGPARAGATDTSHDRPALLSSDPVAERSAYQREKRTRLGSYGWIDREHGIAHIPVERAMQLQVEADAQRRAQQ